MSNDYFNHTALGSFVKVSSSAVNAIFQSISQGLESLPTRVMFQSGTANFAEDTGAFNSYVVNRPYAATTLTDGMKVRFKVGAGNTNTAFACTINVDNLGVRVLILANGSNPAVGDLTAGDFIEAVYDEDTTRFLITSAVRSMYS